MRDGDRRDMGTSDVMATAEWVMELAERLRERIRQRRPSERQARLLTGLWLVWTWADRARTEALDPSHPLGRSAWMVSYASRLIDLLLSGPASSADSLMGLILLGGAVDLSDPATRTRYATWVLNDAETRGQPLPRPYHPRPGRYPPWYAVFYYRLLGRRKALRFVHGLLRVGV